MILCCGEALIDMLPRSLEEGGEGFKPAAGGAIFNTAIGLGRLGVTTGFVSAISTDMFGEILINALTASNVGTSMCPRSQQPTTLAFVKLTNGNAEYSFFDENSAGRSLSKNQLPTLPSSVQALHFGAISLIPEPCGSAFEQLMADNQDKVISLDPNVRTSFIKDETAHRARINRMIAMSDIVKVSDDDLEWIAQGLSFEETAQQWLQAGTSIVLITKGAEGAIAYTAKGKIHQPAIPAEVKDTVGAGDTFNSGFIASLSQQALLTKESLKTIEKPALQKALKLAAKISSFTVSQSGANPPWENQIN